MPIFDDVRLPSKPVHMADKIRPDGAVSAKCYPRPRKIDLSRATWTLRPEAVTCAKCKAVMERGER